MLKRSSLLPFKISHRTGALSPLILRLGRMGGVLLIGSLPVAVCISQSLERRVGERFERCEEDSCWKSRAKFIDSQNIFTETVFNSLSLCCVLLWLLCGCHLLCISQKFVIWNHMRSLLSKYILQQSSRMFYLAATIIFYSIQMADQHKLYHYFVISL